MTKRTGPTDTYLREIIVGLKKAAKKNQAAVWEDVAERLGKPRRQKVEVDVVDINRYGEKGDTVIVPGTVLGSGNMTKSVKVAAWRFSGAAKEKIEKAGGSTMSISELLNNNPKGEKVRIMV